MKTIRLHNDVRKLVKNASKRGWSLEMGGRHPRLVHPNLGFLTISASPSDMNAVKAIERDLRKRENGSFRYTNREMAHG